MDKLADLLRQGADKLVNLPTEAQRFVTNPQAFVQLLTGKNALPRETGFAAGATGLPAQQGTVLDPNYQAYMQGYEQGEPFGYAAMATPAVVPVAKALAPKAGQMAENYMVNQGFMPSIVPPSVVNEMGMATNLPRKDLIAKQIDELENTGRAAAGGQVAESNGFFYKGGQFLPTTTAEPGKWKVGKKWIKSGRELIEPGVIANAPTPFSRSIFGPLREYVDFVDNDFKKLKLKEGRKVLETVDDMQTYVPVTLETTWTPRLHDYVHPTPVTIGELIDAYNKGQRWFDVQPNVATITTK